MSRERNGIDVVLAVNLGIRVSYCSEASKVRLLYSCCPNSHDTRYPMYCTWITRITLNARKRLAQSTEQQLYHLIHDEAQQESFGGTVSSVGRYNRTL